MTADDRNITVVLADDHPIVRAGFKQILQNDPGIAIVGEADDGERALRLVEELRPRVAVMDIQMPKLTGLEVAARLQTAQTGTHVILLTMVKDQNAFFGALDLGVEGYVLKDTAIDDILKAVHAVANDQFYVSPELSNLLLKKRRIPSSSGGAAAGIESLTPAERRVLLMVADLKSNQEIAGALFISKRTVENHKVNIARKLGLTGTNGLLKFAVQNREAL